MAKRKITFEGKEDFRKMDHEILPEYYAVLFMSIQNGNDVNEEWMKVKKEMIKCCHIISVTLLQGMNICIL